MKKRQFLTTALVAALSVSSCVTDKDINTSGITPTTEAEAMGLEVSDQFSYQTTKQVKVNFTAPQMLKGSVFSLLAISEKNDTTSVAKGVFDSNGIFSREITVAANIDAFSIQSDYIGLPGDIEVPIVSGEATLDYATVMNRQKTVGGQRVQGAKVNAPQPAGVLNTRTFNASGVPSVLETRDVIDATLLADVNQSLPERQKLNISHPEFLASNAQTSLLITKLADVWVTFVGEGAGWRNSLGYYTYDEGEAPTSVDDITDLNVVFPNVSAKNSGGGLVAGDKVLLGRFQPGTVVSWFLIPNGWNGSSVAIKNDLIHFSQKELNRESNADLRQHMVLLHDVARDISILGFEDVPRDWAGCDQDFNDAIFYASSNPVDAISTVGVKKLEGANDEDGDGVNDALDWFPFDRDKAFNNFYPNEKSTGTLAFEDLWPAVGDYDFNDLVIDYNYNLISNAENKITSMDCTYTVKHIGASYENGFAITLPIASSSISSVTNQSLTKGYFSLNTNGTESGTETNETVIPIFENTKPLQGTERTVTVTFSTPMEASTLGAVPFNPFLIVRGQRAMEVHLPDFAPTSKGSGLGTKHDYSKPETGRYYKTKKNLPWALNVYGTFSVPGEMIPITSHYPRFAKWANSGGTEEKDWYNKN